MYHRMNAEKEERDKEFFKQKRADEEAEKLKKLNSMSEEDKEALLREEEAKKEHEAAKSRAAIKTRAAYGSGAAKNIGGGRGGRGGGVGRGGGGGGRGGRSDIDTKEVRSPVVASDQETSTTYDQGNGVSAIDSSVSMNPVHKQAVSSEEKSETRVELKELPPNWSTEVDQKTGNEFYWNCLTNSARWTRPEIQELEEGWKSALDEAGRTYYWNGKNITWKEPKKLPGDWEARSTDFGKKFFWNSKTNESQWHSPISV